MLPPASSLNPRSHTDDFFGVVGTTLMTTVVPVVIYALYFACSETSGGCPPPLLDIPTNVLRAIRDPSWWASLWDIQATLVYLVWLTYTVVCWAMIPGDWVPGTQLRNGQRKLYKINAFATFLLTLGICFGILIRSGPEAFTYIYEHWIGLVTASVTFSITMSIALYVSSFYPHEDGREKLLAIGGNSESHIYNFWLGRELNPSIGLFDIKTFCELRPGLILWTVINISMACEQAVRLGGPITDSMWLVLLFQGYYVGESLFCESAIFTQMDITTDGLGFMLTIGDLAWVPFTYTLQARYLAFHPVVLGWPQSIAIFLLQCLGYYIFRSANNEKNEFRNGGNSKNLKFMPTERGTNLLISGWWGMVRHPNYLGDLMLGLSWCLPTGFDSPIPYFYFFYFAVLLAHRAHRDDVSCAKKYGKDWDKYKKIVRYQIVPGLY